MSKHRPRTPRGTNPRSLKATQAFTSFVLDQLGEFGDVTPKPMFGGVGLYSRDMFFGIIARDVLYLKTDDETRAVYERAGMESFRPYLDRPERMTNYYAVPVEVLECATDLVAWARDAVAVAERAAGAKGRRS